MSWIVVERIDGETHYTQGLSFKDAKKRFLEINAAGGKVWMKNFDAGKENEK
jgi:uncharacterized membrane protein YkoI